MWEYGYPSPSTSNAPASTPSSAHSVRPESNEGSDAAVRFAGPIGSNSMSSVASGIAALVGTNPFSRWPSLPQMGLGRPSSNQPSPRVFDTGAPPIPYVSSSQGKIGGLPGMIASRAGLDPSNPNEPVPPPGGLPGLLLEWMHNNQNNGVGR